MEHAHHFLSRLDRITPEQVDFALALYRDHELVRYVLSQASLPAEAPRVAIAVEDSGTGPFLVVTRDGQFVTCLGAGMSTGDLPILTRGKIEALEAKRNDVHARIAAATEAIRRRGDAEAFTSILFKAGPFLSREDFVALSVLQALMEDRLFSKYLGVATTLETLKGKLLKIERPKPISFPAMRQYWEHLWALGHLGVIAFMDGKTLLERWSERVDIEYMLPWPCIRQANSLLAMRGIWIAAKTGKVQLRLLKSHFETAPSILQFLTAAFSLGAIALRHSRLHGEIRKTIASAEVGDAAIVAPDYFAAIKQLLLAALDSAEGHQGLHQIIGKRSFMKWAEEYGKHKLEPEFQFASEADVPDDIAYPWAVHDTRSFLTDTDSMIHIFVCLPWLAKAEPQDLFLPRKIADRMRLAFRPSDCAELMKPLREHYRGADIALAQREPGKPARKGPCPCGSGKKYKRCCGKDEPVGEDEE